MRRFFTIAMICAVLAGTETFLLGRAAGADTKAGPVNIQGGYAVVVSEKTLADPAWKKVVQALQAKYRNAKVITFKNEVTEVREPLAKLLPRYACFVGQPSEVGRAFVVNVHRLTRQLNDDPYTDTIWGVLTGYSPENAMEIASLSEPLVVRKGLGLGMNLGPFDEGICISDGKMGATDTKTTDGKGSHTELGDADRARDFVRALNEMKPDFLGSDGHATEHDLQMPWSRGQLHCAKGKVFGITVKGEKCDIDSPNPKVYLAYGNCLIGHVNGQEAIALALMNSAGMKQMIGYTVPTWYGKMGWGAADWYYAQPGRFSFADVFFISHQVLLHDLRKRFPKNAGYDIDLADLDGEAKYLGRIASKLGHEPGETQEQMKDKLGMLWDRDTVALLGDPAWDARFAPRQLDWDQKVTCSGEQYTLTITPHKDMEIGGVFVYLPKRVKNVKIQKGADLEPVVGSFFILIPKLGKVEKDKNVTVTFTADPAPSAAK